MEKLLLITPHLSTGGAPQFILNRIELLKDTYDVYCVEYDFLSPDFVVQRNKIIEILSKRDKQSFTSIRQLIVDNDITDFDSLYK